jgi:hypothetical protein
MVERLLRLAEVRAARDTTDTAKRPSGRCSSRLRLRGLHLLLLYLLRCLLLLLNRDGGGRRRSALLRLLSLRRKRIREM